MQSRILILKEFLDRLCGCGDFESVWQRSGDIFIAAFTHKSYLVINSSAQHYETLETLGDSVISLVVADHLYKKKYSLSELNRIKKVLIAGRSISFIAKELGIENYVFTQGCEVTTSMSEDVYEAMIGAIYSSMGLEVARKVVYETLIRAYEEGILEIFVDCKTLFNEYIGANRKLYEGNIRYLETKRYRCEDGKILFQYQVKVGNRIFGLGEGYRVKDAEQNAAKAALLKLRVL